MHCNFLDITHFANFSIYNLYQQILKEFELAYPGVNAAAFVDKWPVVATKLRGILTNHYKEKEFRTDWSVEVENVLIILKMFPCPQVGRNVIASNATFEKATEKFIKFEPVLICLFVKNNQTLS